MTQFQLTLNVCAVVITFVSGVTMAEAPLKIKQLMWVNMIIGTLASFVLATEDPTPELLYKRPHRKNESIITRQMLKYILG